MLLVITCDQKRCPTNIMDTVKSLASKLGLGYLFVRNRTNFKDTFEQAMKSENHLFRTHVHLSKIPKSLVGIPNLVEKIANIQPFMLFNALPNITSEIDQRLQQSLSTLNGLPVQISSTNAIPAFSNLVNSSMVTLREKLISKDFDQEECRLGEHLSLLFQTLNSTLISSRYFLEDEILLLDDSTHQTKSPFACLIEEK